MFWKKKSDENAIATKKRGRDDRLTHTNHIAEDFGDLYISNISSRNVNEWRNKQAAKGLKNSTINKHIDFLFNIMKMAYVWGYIDDQLHLKIDVKKLPVGNYTQKFLTPYEIQRLLNGCMISPHPYLYLVVKILLLTGARVGELRNAKWIDIDERKMVWHVPVSKTGRSREILLSAEAMSTFHKIRKKSEFFGTWDPQGGYILTNPRTRTKYDSFYAAWYKVVRVENLADVRIHDLRHTYASLLINNEVSIYEVQRLLGHSNITMTQRYAHLNKDKLHERTEVVSKCIRNAWI
jgi:integrase